MKPFIKRFLILSALLVSMLTAVSATNEETITVTIGLNSTLPDNPVTLALPENGEFDYENPTYGAQLEDPIALAAYEEFLKITPETSKVTISLDQFELTGPDHNLLPYQCFSQVSAAFAAFMFDHPEMHYFTPDLNAGFSFGMSSKDSGKTYKLTSTSLTLVQEENSKQMKSDLDALLAQFKADFDSTRSPAQQYRYIHDYVCDLAAYDYEAAALGGQSDAHSAYGLLLMDKKVVCEGYSKSFKVLCDAVGLPCILVAGEATEYVDKNGLPFFTGISNHMWNAVQIGESWYAVDTTWDDFDEVMLTPDSDAEIGFCTYDYFLKNDRFLFSSKEHDHRPSGSIYYANFTPMLFGMPKLAEGSCPGVEAFSTETLHILYKGTDLSVASIIDGYQVNGVALSDVPHLDIYLEKDQVLASSIHIPAGMRYTLSAIPSADEEDDLDQPDLRTVGRTISYADGFAGPLFVLSGGLSLNQVSLNTAPDKPLVQLSGGSVSGMDITTFTYKPASPANTVRLRAAYDESGRMTSLTPMEGAESYTYEMLFPERVGAYSRDYLLFLSPLFPAPLVLTPTL